MSNVNQRKKNRKTYVQSDSSAATNYFENIITKPKPDDCEKADNKIFSPIIDVAYESGLDALYNAASNFESTIFRSCDDENEIINKTKHSKSSNFHENKVTSSNESITEISTVANEVMHVITFSPKNPYYTQMMNESRLDYLIRVPILLQAAINSYNLEKLKFLINEVATEDCLLKVSYLEVYHGRDKWYDQLVTILNTVPDLYVANTPPMLYHRSIVMKQYRYGTMGALTGINNNAKKDYLWNPFKTLPVEKMDAKMKSMKATYDKCIIEGKLMHFDYKVIVFYMLNKEMTHFEQRVSYCESFELYEANVEDFFRDSNV